MRLFVLILVGTTVGLGAVVFPEWWNIVSFIIGYFTYRLLNIISEKNIKEENKNESDV